MVIGLHTTGSPVSRAERKNINENWERIIDGLTRLQTQINVLAGGKEVDDLLKSVQDAIDNAYSSVNKAIDENNAATQEAINNFNTSLELALSSISNALQVTETAITNANQATVDAKNATSDANTAVKTINEKFVEATQVIDSLNALKIQLEQMEQQLETAQSDVEIATANANNATQSAVDATNTMVAKMDEADTAIANANNAANTANQATEAIKGWGTATVWNSTTTYEKNNVVTDNGSTWQTLRQNTNTKPVEGLDWTCLARKGVDGTGSVGSVNGQYPDETGNVTLDLGQGTVKKINGKDPDGTGEVVLTASDLGAFSGSLLENGSVIMKKLSQEVQDAIANASGGGNSYFMPYTLATTEENQKTWGLPANSYDAATDSLLVFYNASLLDSSLWNVTGDAGTGYKVNIPDAPIDRIEDNNVTVTVLRNSISSSPEEISGILLTDASVGLQKLGQDVHNAINSAGSKVEIANDLVTTDPAIVLAASQGKALKKMIDATNTVVEDLPKLNTLSPATIDNTGQQWYRKSLTFSSTLWNTDPTAKEFAYVNFPVANFMGTVKMTITSGYNVGNAAGSAVVIWHIGKAGTANHTKTMEIISISPTFANTFYVDDVVYDVNRMYFPIHKKAGTINALFVSMEVYTDYSRFNDINLAEISKDANSSFPQPWTPQKVSYYMPNTDLIIKKDIPFFNIQTTDGLKSAEIRLNSNSVNDYGIDFYKNSAIYMRVAGQKNVQFFGHDDAWFSIQDLKKSASDVKTNVAAAITAQGVTTSPTATGAQMAANIRTIPTGAKKSSGTTAVTSNRPGYVAGFIRIANLGFIPRTIVAKRNSFTSDKNRSCAVYYSSPIVFGDINLYVDDNGNKYQGKSGGNSTEFWLQVESPNGALYDWQAYGD
ncbi:hypothetical protein [Lysinibacillus sphaericus]|uniref:hypothetical protein n=1 Tax=Lysinibacillus sphaericus TaxID=1421 RepID=UPI003D00434B